jgi:hypothetical protein
MANTKISAFANASTLGGGEYLAGVQGGVNVKITPDQINLAATNYTNTQVTYAIATSESYTNAAIANVAAGIPVPNLATFDIGWINQSTANATAGLPGVSIIGNSNDGLHLLAMTAPTPPYTVNFLVNFISTSGDGGPLMMIGWCDSVSGKIEGIAPQTNNRVVHKKYDNPTSLNSYDLATGGDFMYVPTWYQLHDNGTNIYIGWPGDGINFLPYYSVAKSSGFLGFGGYNQIVFGTDPASATNIVTLNGLIKL